MKQRLFNILYFATACLFITPTVVVLCPWLVTGAFDSGEHLVVPKTGERTTAKPKIPVVSTPARPPSVTIAKPMAIPAVTPMTVAIPEPPKPQVSETLPPAPVKPEAVAVAPAAADKPAVTPKSPVETKREARARKRAKWLKAAAETVAAVAEHKEEIVGGVKAVSEEIKRAKQEQKTREDAGK